MQLPFMGKSSSRAYHFQTFRLYLQLEERKYPKLRCRFVQFIIITFHYSFLKACCFKCLSSLHFQNQLWIVRQLVELISILLGVFLKRFLFWHHLFLCYLYFSLIVYIRTLELKVCSRSFCWKMAFLVLILHYLFFMKKSLTLIWLPRELHLQCLVDALISSFWETRWM